MSLQSLWWGCYFNIPKSLSGALGGSPYRDIKCYTCKRGKNRNPNMMIDTIKGHLLAHPGYSAISIFWDYTANSLLQCMIKFGGNMYRKLHTWRHICPQLLNWDMMGWWVATWCLGMFSWAPTAQYSSASSSISILALGLKLAGVVDTGSTLPDCSNFSCFKPHEP